MKEIEIASLSFNPFTKIGKEWMLITAGDSGKHNTMTASWGGVGVLWGRNVATVYVRHHRYTFGFVEDSDYYSCCFFDEKYREALNLCGTKSGRDIDKPAAAGLTPVFDYPAPYYAEASLVFICRKLYHQDLKEEFFTDISLPDAIYPQKDFHRMFVGEIVTVLQK
jgi:flavin reductase (DIM6/NTAB) family NADH-FMN oxidoreductase RutF